MSAAHESLHPVIRLASLFVFAALVPWLQPVALLAVAGVLLVIAWRAKALRAALRGLRRVRWLLLSIAILYILFHPGEPLLPALGDLSPSLAGLQLAAWRAGVLGVMVWAAAVVLALTPPRELTAALRHVLGWPVALPVTVRFADRVGLLLAELPAIQDRVGTSLRGSGGFAGRAASLVRDVETLANDDGIQPEAALKLGAVPAWQWTLPSALALCMLLMTGNPW